MIPCLSGKLTCSAATKAPLRYFFGFTFLFFSCVQPLKFFSKFYAGKKRMKRPDQYDVKVESSKRPGLENDGFERKTDVDSLKKKKGVLHQT